jgi:hypothetical protein
MGIDLIESGLILSIFGTFLLGLSQFLGMSVGGFQKTIKKGWKDLEEDEIKFKSRIWKYLNLLGWVSLFFGFLLQLISVNY